EGLDGGGRVPLLWRFGVLPRLSRFGCAAQGLRAVPETLRRAVGARSERDVPLRRARTGRPAEPRGHDRARARGLVARWASRRGPRGRGGFFRARGGHRGLPAAAGAAI